MREIPADVLTEAAYNVGLEREDIREFDYNGRYYAKNCFGIVGGIREYSEFLVEVASLEELGSEYASWLIDTVTTDSMGLNTIFYFPGIQPYTEEDNEDEQ